MGRVQVHVGAAGAQHREQGDEHVQGAGQGERHDPLRADPVCAQEPGQPVDAVEELGPGHTAAVGNHGDSVRVVCSELVEQAGDERGVLVDRWCSGPGRGGAGEVEACHRSVGRGRSGRVEQADDLGESSLDVCGIVAAVVGVGFQGEAAVRGAVDRESQIVDGPLGQGHRGSGNPVEGQVVVEQFDVDLRAEQRAVRADQGEVAASHSAR